MDDLGDIEVEGEAVAGTDGDRRQLLVIMMRLGAVGPIKDDVGGGDQLDRCLLHGHFVCEAGDPQDGASAPRRKCVQPVWIRICAVVARGNHIDRDVADPVLDVSAEGLHQGVSWGD